MLATKMTSYFTPSTRSSSRRSQENFDEEDTHDVAIKETAIDALDRGISSLRKPQSSVPIFSHSMSNTSCRKDDDNHFADGTMGANKSLLFQSTVATTCLILLLGAMVSGAFLGLGISSAMQAQQDQFVRMAIDLTNKIESAWQDYITAAGLVHGRCRDRNFSRDDFRDLYEYLVAGGLSFRSVQFVRNTTRDERADAEAEARAFYSTNYPQLKYRGFTGYQYDNSTVPSPRPQTDYYFAVQNVEPVAGNEAAPGFDYASGGSRRITVMSCIESGKPSLTDRVRFVNNFEPYNYAVVLLHPGYNLTTHNDIWPRDLATIVIRIRDLLGRAVENQVEAASVYIYDESDSTGSTSYLGAVSVTPNAQQGSADLAVLPEVELSLLQQRQGRYRRQAEVLVANKVWIIYVTSENSAFQPEYTYVIIGGVFIFLASCFLACWIYRSTQRLARISLQKSKAEAERAALIVDNVRQAAKAERELNDFIAHEIRNPVSAAISACSFVKAAVNQSNPLQDAKSFDTFRDDVHIIDTALKFVNDLLRNMLDMHRAASKQLKVSLAPTDVLHDVLEPTASILAQRGGKVQVIVECPNNLFVMSDRLRLKQVVLNLGRNSSKFVEEGFIRLVAKEERGSVIVVVEDSGPGIPEEKRNHLFKKYQESLDVLCQGTGIGLFLCMNLVELMGGRIYLDETYDSGVTGLKGARFVVDLQQPPINTSLSDSIHKDETKAMDGDSVRTDPTNDDDELPHSLPAELSVLFVDDDLILRKLFARTIRTVCPEWVIREASSGETALQLVETTHFDLIFMDMYMASIEKQMLGTETVRELRARGITCRICGLSANDKETEFLDAGADAFTLKPFPCEATALRHELSRVLHL